MVQQASDVRHAIDQVNRQFVEAFNRGDAAGAVAVYTEDATILPPGSPRVRGRDGIRQFWQAVMDSGVSATSGGSSSSLLLFGVGSPASSRARRGQSSNSLSLAGKVRASASPMMAPNSSASVQAPVSALSNEAAGVQWL